MTSNKSTTDFDKELGEKIKQMRGVVGCSRQTVAKYLGVTHQQITKYETGENRVSAQRLMQLCHFFKCSYETFLTEKWEVVDVNRNTLDHMNQYSILTSDDQVIINRVTRSMADKTIKLDILV